MNQPQQPEGVTTEDLMIGSWIDKQTQWRPRAAYDMTLEDAFAEGVCEAILHLKLDGTVAEEDFKRIARVEAEDFYSDWNADWNPQDGDVSTVTLAQSYGMGLGVGGGLIDVLIEESLSPFEQTDRPAAEQLARTQRIPRIRQCCGLCEGKD